MRALFCCIAFVTILSARNLTPAWVELGPDGRNVARIVVETGDACPSLTADGRALPMQRREPVPEGFQPACEAAIPANTKSLKLGEQNLKLPASPASVVVFGDTGCRINDKQLQNCSDPMAWPFLHNTRTIAKEKPDLIVHVGDYLYREVECPDASRGCTGPHGDNWPAWNADFFARPAAPALAAAAVAVFTRGNLHESCARGRGRAGSTIWIRVLSTVSARSSRMPGSQRPVRCASACWIRRSSQMQIRKMRAIYRAWRNS